MNEESDFARALREDPADIRLRLVFADWLEERGDPRAELVLLPHTLTQSVGVPARPGLEARPRGLLSKGVRPIGPFRMNSLGMRFAWVPPGTFLMGSPPGEIGRRDEEVLRSRPAGHVGK